jgi:predicted permease
MRLLYILRSRVRSILFRNRREDDLAEELRLHIERQTEYWIAQGVDPHEARLRAHRQFGNVESLKEESRDARGTAVWDTCVRDTREGLRRLGRDWRFSVPAVLILAIGIGANTAIFSLVNASLFRQPPFADPDRLVDVYQNTRDGSPGTNSYPVFLDIAASSDVFAGVAATSVPDSVSYRDRGAVREAIVEYASASYGPVLGLRPFLGRWFNDSDDRPAAPLVTVLGHRTWTTHFASDRTVIGRTIRMQGVPVTIVGVAPVDHQSTFTLGVVTEFWIPINAMPTLEGTPRALERRPVEAPFFVKARLRDGMTAAQAQAAMDGLGRRLAKEYPSVDPGKGLRVMRSSDVRVHPMLDIVLRAIASLLLAVVGLVLAVACSNLATLLLVRAAARSKEVAVRLAMGATRRQLVRHLLTESLLLSIAGGIAGSALAWAFIRFLRTVELPVVVEVNIDYRVLGFAIALSVVTGVLFGLAPALKATRVDLLTTLRDDGQTWSAVEGRRLTLKNALIVFQVTVSVVLLAATGVFLQIVGAARAQRSGFAVNGLAMLQTDLRFSGYSGAQQANLLEELRRRIAAIPGVHSALLTRGTPMKASGLPLVIEGGAADRTSVLGAGALWAPPGFFETMQIPILFGRSIEARDREGAPLVAVVSEAMARQYFGSVNAVGRRFRIDQDTKWIEVVGVARNTGSDDLNDDLIDPSPQVFYRPFSQWNVSPDTIMARTTLDASVLVGAMQRELMSLDPSLPVSTAQTMAERLERSLGAPQAVAMFLGVLGALGLALAAIGLYAVIAFAVARQSREIGIRMALGARGQQVVWNVARDVARLLGTGTAIGIGLSILVVMAMRVFANPAPGIAIYRPNVDPLQLAAIAACIFAVGVAAALIPARRAVNMNPLSALRNQ